MGCRNLNISMFWEGYFVKKKNLSVTSVLRSAASWTFNCFEKVSSFKNIFSGSTLFPFYVVPRTGPQKLDRLVPFRNTFSVCCFWIIGCRTLNIKRTQLLRVSTPTRRNICFLRVGACLFSQSAIILNYLLRAVSCVATIFARACRHGSRGVSGACATAAAVWWLVTHVF